MFFQQWNQQQQQQQGGAGGILQARLNPGQKQGGDNPTLKGLLNQGPQGPSQPQLGVNISLLVFVCMRPKSWGIISKPKDWPAKTLVGNIKKFTKIKFQIRRS